VPQESRKLPINPAGWPLQLVGRLRDTACVHVAVDTPLEVELGLPVVELLAEEDGFAMLELLVELPVELEVELEVGLEVELEVELLEDGGGNVPLFNAAL
jgi:hypothetical protein